MLLYILENNHLRVYLFIGETSRTQWKDTLCLYHFLVTESKYLTPTIYRKRGLFWLIGFRRFHSIVSWLQSGKDTVEGFDSGKLLTIMVARKKRGGPRKGHGPFQVILPTPTSSKKTPPPNGKLSHIYHIWMASM